MARPRTDLSRCGVVSPPGKETQKNMPHADPTRTPCAREGCFRTVPAGSKHASCSFLCTRISQELEHAHRVSKATGDASIWVDAVSLSDALTAYYRSDARMSSRQRRRSVSPLSSGTRSRTALPRWPSAVPSLDRLRQHSRQVLSAWALFVQTAAPDEDLCQPFRFADHQHVAGVDLDEGLYTTKGFNVLTLHLR